MGCGCRQMQMSMWIQMQFVAVDGCRCQSMWIQTQIVGVDRCRCQSV